MSIVKTIGDFFRSAPKDKPTTIDRYEILSPLMSAQEYAQRSLELVTLLQSDTEVMDILSKKVSSKNKHVETGVLAYQSYVKDLDHNGKKFESKKPLESVTETLTSILTNLNHVENHFPSIFGGNTGDIDEENIRTSSLIIIGYIEVISEYCTWIGTLIRHITADEHDLIPPFETKSLTVNTKRMAEFSDFNLGAWNGAHDGILTAIHDMQKKGADVAIKSGDTWIDQFVHDAQYSHMEQTMLHASLRHPVMMLITAAGLWQQYWVDLNTSRKDWLVAKIALETERLRGMDTDSAEYKKLRKATDKYAELAAKYEQKIARQRA